MLTFDNDFLPAAQDLMEADLNGRAAGKLFTVIEAASLDELREFRGGLRLLELNQRLRISTFGERFTRRPGDEAHRHADVRGSPPFAGSLRACGSLNLIWGAALRGRAPPSREEEA